MRLSGKLGHRGIISAIHPSRLFFVTGQFVKSPIPSRHGLCLVNHTLAALFPSHRAWVVGGTPCTVIIGGVPRQWTFLLPVVSFPILGANFFHHHSLVVDVANQRLSPLPFRVNAVVPERS